MLPVMDNIHKADDERRGVKRKMALSGCDICETEEAKYRCPNCMKHTCSLACVKQHKMVSGCSGVRDKTAFVPLAGFNEINLLSDYRFLEDTSRLRQQSSRDAVLLASRRHPKEGMWMIRKAKAVKVTLKFLPKMFSKHRENSTIFRHAERRFHWHLKIHFPQSDAVYSERFPDNKQLDQILSGFIHPTESDPVKRQKLKVYVSSPQEDIRVFLKAEQKQPNSLRFFQLDLKKSLQENLMYKTIVEYPEVFVVLNRHSQEYLTRVADRSRAEDVASANISRSSGSAAPERVMKRLRVSAEEELEDGELRSEDDEDASLGETDRKEPVVHPEEDDDDDEDEDGNQSAVVSANISSRSGDGDGVDNAEVCTDAGNTLPEDHETEGQESIESHVGAEAEDL